MIDFQDENYDEIENYEEIYNLITVQVQIYLDELIYNKKYI